MEIHNIRESVNSISSKNVVAFLVPQEVHTNMNFYMFSMVRYINQLLDNNCKVTLVLLSSVDRALRSLSTQEVSNNHVKISEILYILGLKESVNFHLLSDESFDKLHIIPDLVTSFGVTSELLYLYSLAIARKLNAEVLLDNETTIQEWTYILGKESSGKITLALFPFIKANLCFDKDFAIVLRKINTLNTREKETLKECMQKYLGSSSDDLFELSKRTFIKLNKQKAPTSLTKEIVGWEDGFQVANALANPVRMEVFKLIAKKEMYMRGLAMAMKLYPSTISYHLSKLQKAGLVRSIKRKNRKYFYLSIKEIVWRLKDEV